jgi:hypothetical protein
LATAAADPVDTFSIALADSVDLTHAPVAVNDSERLLFRQLFPTLIRIDCEGRVQPDLALRWEPDSARRTWTFFIPEDAWFPDGSPVTASTVSASWLHRWSDVQELGLDTIVVLDQQRLAVTLKDPVDSLPRLFADPRMAVVPQDLPLGPSRLVLGFRPDQPVIEIRVSGTADLRDALDAGADLVVSRDPSVIEYAASRPEFETFPLPWDRTYALLQPAGSPPLPAALRAHSTRHSLAYDAVRADARPSDHTVQWHGACDLTKSMQGNSPSTTRLVYPGSDPVARQLAERITAIAGETLQLRAVGLDATSFEAALQQGRDRGYIMSLEHRSLSSCVGEMPASATRVRVEPLIDSRSHAIVRRGSPLLTVDWDGTVRAVLP